MALAGKSGTSNEQRDSWFAGFGGDYAVVVWIGHDDNSPTPLTGSKGALEIWSRTMSQINRQGLRFSAPGGIEYFPVNPDTGAQLLPECSNAASIPYYRDFPPQVSAPGLFDSVCQ